jgi:plastocyanin
MLACSLLALGARAAALADVRVRIDNFTFVPADLTIAPGTSVTWENADDMVHSIVSTTGAFRSHALDTGDTFAFTFDSAGVFEYSCGLHPRMRGRIVVAP